MHILARSQQRAFFSSFFMTNFFEKIFFFSSNALDFLCVPHFFHLNLHVVFPLFFMPFFYIFWWSLTSQILCIYTHSHNSPLEIFFLAYSEMIIRSHSLRFFFTREMHKRYFISGEIDSFMWPQRSCLLLGAYIHLWWDQSERFFFRNKLEWE